MVDEITATVRETRSATGKQEFDERVLAVMGTVPRHLFVPAESQRAAYEDHPLPIGHGQTISQPYIVAFMTEAPGAWWPATRCWRSAPARATRPRCWPRLVARVYSIEIVEPLAREAAERLARLGYRNVDVRAGDGYHGWPEPRRSTPSW